MFACLYAPSLPADLVGLAREFSPRVEEHAPGLVTLDVGGLGRIFGDTQAIGEAIERSAAGRRLPVHVAVAATRTAAMLLARARRGLTIVPPGKEAAMLARLPVEALVALPQRQGGTGVGERAVGRSFRVGEPAVGRSFSPAAVETQAPRTQSRKLSSAASATSALIDTLSRWGIRTLGQLAALPPAPLSERLGQEGLAWQRLARGEDPAPLVPDLPEERFEETLELEWPVEGLEPLAFVLGRLCDALSARLERADRGVAVLHVRLQLVTRDVHARSVQLAAPIRDPRVLRTLVLLDLESHPPSAGIDRVTVAVDPAPGRIVQFSLLARALPQPEQMSTLVARLAALMGDAHVGAPRLVDSYRPGAFEMATFVPDERTGFSAQRARRAPRPGKGSGTVARVAESREPFASGSSVSGTNAPDNGHVAPHTGRLPQLTPAPPTVCSATRPSPDGREDISAASASSALNDRPGSETREPRAQSREMSSACSVLNGHGTCAIRRFRIPVPARVTFEDGRPVRVVTDRRGLTGGRVEACAGPWRTSGEWWRVPDARVETRPGSARLLVGWNRDEWDVALGDGAVYRVYRDRDRDRWFIDGIVD
jgi:nucleotidyltransferase/DNA polymerase involved in DNA repair